MVYRCPRSPKPCSGNTETKDIPGRDHLKTILKWSTGLPERLFGLTIRFYTYTYTYVYIYNKIYIGSILLPVTVDDDG